MNLGRDTDIAQRTPRLRIAPSIALETALRNCAMSLSITKKISYSSARSIKKRTGE